MKNYKCLTNIIIFPIEKYDSTLHIILFAMNYVKLI